MVENCIQWISHDDILSLKISSEKIFDALISTYTDICKEHIDLPKKVIIRKDQEFYTTMPIVINGTSQNYQSKMVWRAKDTCPAIQSTISVIQDGSLKAVLDGSYITTMRTGALAAITAWKLAQDNFTKIAMIGLGNCSAAALHMLCYLTKGRALEVKLVNYHNTPKFIKVFKNHYPQLEFTTHSSLSDCGDVDIIFSGVTFADKPMLSKIPPGCVIVPMHVRGFMFADTQADYVITDDIHGIDHFKMFDSFKHKLFETRDVLLNKIQRSSPEQTFLVYQYGTALSDAAITNLVLSIATTQRVGTVLPFSGPQIKDWVLDIAK